MENLLERLKSALASRYAIERELGSGGMAVVFLAHDQKLGRPVALKVLRPELAASLGAERFLREIEIAAKLTHPHILSLYDCGEANGLLYYVMPYVEGESLRDRLNRERQLSIEDALQITREVSDALGHAHSLGIVHRDIKPENILFEAGHAVVADFGIARAVSEAGGEKLTETGIAVGTPAYMSPEQAAGEREPDSRTDIYALGCVLYEMLGGEPPYTGPSAQAILARKSLEPVPSLRTVRETVTGGIEQAIFKALAKAPADRFATAQQFADALVAGEEGDVPGARPRRPARTWRMLAAAVSAVVLVTLGAWWALDRFAAESGRIESLAVLPLSNLTGDPELEFYVQGMHDELIQELAQIGALRVMSRTSVMRYQNTDKPLPEIADELNVDAVVEGSVFRAGDSVRIQVQLIAAAPERHLWSQTYDGNAREVLAFHTEAARAIAQQIRLVLTPEQEARLASAQVIDPLAYDLYLKGRFHWNRLIGDGLERATASLEEAITKDSTYASAYALLARTQALSAFFSGEPPGPAVGKAREAALKALALDETLAEAHAALGDVRFYYDWDWAGAEREYTRAIELNPSDLGSHQAYAFFLMWMGRIEEAVAEIEQARELDPLNLFVNTMVGWPYYYARQYDRAAEQFRAVLELDPNYDLAHYNLGLQYAQLRRYDEAIAEFQRAIDIAGAGTLTIPGIHLGRAYAEAGRTEDALEILDGLREMTKRAEYVPPTWFMEIFIGLGETDSALVWLRRAHDVRDPWMTELRQAPGLDPLRSEPQFQEILSRMNFPQ